MSSFDSSRPVVLFALLDWGMGHATRTAPLIQFAVDQGWAVHVATKGTALAFLRTQFSPEAISFHTKPGPDITYAKRGTWMKIAAQVPEFLSSIRKETSWTAEFVARHGITHIVSDNCYGVHHPDIPCVLMSHQLQLPVPNAVAALASTFVNKHAAQFRSVWIPDDESVGLSGALTSHHQLPHAEYVGILSRLSPHAAQGNWRTVGMVSGPEPHRKLMELALLRWMKGIPGPCLLIAGRPGDEVEVNDHVTVWPDPSAEDLAGALLRSRNHRVPFGLFLALGFGCFRAAGHFGANARPTGTVALGPALGSDLWHGDVHAARTGIWSCPGRIRLACPVRTQHQGPAGVIGFGSERLTSLHGTHA